MKYCCQTFVKVSFDIGQFIETQQTKTGSIPMLQLRMLYP